MKRPREILEAWVDAFNSGDADRVAKLYAEDAVNHQVVTDPVVGRDAIRERLRQEFAQADMTCIVENIVAEENWAALEWRDPGGLRGCGFFQIVDGQITFQRGYWDRLSFLRQHGLPIPRD